MHLKYKPTLNATLGESYGFGNKRTAYGDVTGVIQEESPIFQKLLKEQYERKRRMNTMPPNVSRNEAMTEGSNYDGSMATLKALYSSGYINQPKFSDKLDKVSITQGLKEAMKVKEPSHRFYGPSILF
jgi:hypothetical protein